MMLLKLAIFCFAAFLLGLSLLGYLMRCPFHATLYLVAGMGAVATGAAL